MPLVRASTGAGVGMTALPYDSTGAAERLAAECALWDLTVASPAVAEQAIATPTKPAMTENAVLRLIA